MLCSLLLVSDLAANTMNLQLPDDTSTLILPIALLSATRTIGCFYRELQEQQRTDRHLLGLVRRSGTAMGRILVFVTTGW